MFTSRRMESLDDPSGVKMEIKEIDGYKEKSTFGPTPIYGMPW